MSSSKSADTLDLAHAKGELAGSDLRQSARDCPYLHDQRELRGAWLDGFSRGRVDMGKPTLANGHG